MVYGRKRETRCVCVSKKVARGRSLWSSLCWMHLVCPWHFPSLLDTHASCWGGQVLLGLSYIHPQSRCLTHRDSEARVHTHTHKGCFGIGQMWYIYQLITATQTSGTTFQLIAVQSVWNIKMMRTGVMRFCSPVLDQHYTEGHNIKVNAF